MNSNPGGGGGSNPVIPEPSTFALGLGAVALGLIAQRKRLRA